MPGSLVVRNTALNLLARIATAVVGAVAIPIILRAMGAERFGLLALAWAVLGTMTLFDLGLGKATIRFVAHFLGAGENHRLAPLAWTSVLLNVVLGLIAGAALLAMTPMLVSRVFHVSESFGPEARATFHLLALIVPMMMIGSVWSSVLEAGQRYDLVNAVGVPVSAFNFLIPAVGVRFGLRLPGILLLLLLIRAVAATAYFLISLKLFPVLRCGMAVDKASLRALFGYGRWVALSNAIWPGLLYLDRFLIGTLVSVVAVGFYAAPFEIVARLSMLPASMVALFPAYSTLSSGRRSEAGHLYARANKHLLLILGPLAMLVIVFAGPLLGLWLGQEFRTRSTAVLQVLTLGVVAVSFASLADSLAKGLGRPDITAKLHLVELPLYALLGWLLISHYGILGAAFAWTLRAAVDALLMFLACRKLLPSAGSAFAAAGMPRAVLTFIALAVAMATITFFSHGRFTIVCAAALLMAFAGVSWRYVLDSTERGSLQTALGISYQG